MHQYLIHFYMQMCPHTQTRFLSRAVPIFLASRHVFPSFLCGTSSLPSSQPQSLHYGATLKHKPCIRGVPLYFQLCIYNCRQWTIFREFIRTFIPLR